MRLFFLLLFPLLAASAADPGSGGKLILEDNFSSPAIHSGWKAAKGQWQQAGGVITAAELPAEKHAAVMRRKVAYTNAAIEVHFRLNAARQVALSLNGAEGHICRVTVRPDGMSLVLDADSKTGRKAVVLVAAKGPVPADQWHVLHTVVSGRSLKARIGDGEWVEANHDAIGAPKVDIGLPVAGKTADFDLVRVRELP